MKKVVQLSLIAVATFTMSCGETEEVKPSTEDVKVSDTTIVETVEVVEVHEEHIDKLVESKYHYDEDWNRFKEAVVNNDISGVSAFASSDEIDAEAITFAFSDPDFLKLLQAATYDDLTTDTEGPEVLLVYTASMSYFDNDGTEYESALMLYFSQGETGLMLENFFTAG